jgi:hypothetical protein
VCLFLCSFFFFNSFVEGCRWPIRRRSLAPAAVATVAGEFLAKSKLWGASCIVVTCPGSCPLKSLLSTLKHMERSSTRKNVVSVIKFWFTFRVLNRYLAEVQFANSVNGYKPHRGFGFVEFSTEDEATAALKAQVAKQKTKMVVF